MKFPDFNIGYVFGYGSGVADEGIRVTFLNGRVRIQFRYQRIEKISRKTYTGGRISWDIIRWGKCPPGTEALEVVLKTGWFRNHLIVFDELNAAISEIEKQGITVTGS